MSNKLQKKFKKCGQRGNASGKRALNKTKIYELIISALNMYPDASVDLAIGNTIKKSNPNDED